MAHLLADHTDFDQIMATDANDEEIILVKQAEVVHAYRNSCPHVGIGLDYGDGRCLHDDATLICSLHGAQFEADTGFCTVGPCSGKSLQRVPIIMKDGKIFLDA